MKIFFSDWHILETICLFCFCVLFSNIYPKIKIYDQNLVWHAISIAEWFVFLNFCLWKYSLLFFAVLELLMLYNNIVKISEKCNKRNLLIICFQVTSTYPTDFCIIFIHFYYGKQWKYLIFFKNQWLEFNFFFCMDSYNKWFYIKSWQSLQIYFFCVKHHL